MQWTRDLSLLRRVGAHVRSVLSSRQWTRIPRLVTSSCTTWWYNPRQFTVISLSPPSGTALDHHGSEAPHYSAQALQSQSVCALRNLRDETPEKCCDCPATVNPACSKTRFSVFCVRVLVSCFLRLFVDAVPCFIVFRFCSLLFA